MFLTGHSILQNDEDLLLNDDAYLSITYPAPLCSVTVGIKSAHSLTERRPLHDSIHSEWIQRDPLTLLPQIIGTSQPQEKPFPHPLTESPHPIPLLHVPLIFHGVLQQINKPSSDYRYSSQIFI